MNSACIMPLKGMLGPQTVLIKSHIISLSRKRRGKSSAKRDGGEQAWGIAKERSLTLTSSCLLGMVILCKHKSQEHTDKDVNWEHKITYFLYNHCHISSGMTDHPFLYAG